MMRSRKSRFWGFCLSFIPGCAEMYMGFMKMGLSLMTLFWGIIGLATLLNIGPLLFLDLIVWFYSFFHARNMAHMTDEAFERLGDDYLFHFGEAKEAGRMFKNQTVHRIAAAVLILLGAILCLRSMRSLLFGYLPMWMSEWIDELIYLIPQMAVGVCIIALGCWMIMGKKRELFEEEQDREPFYGEESWIRDSLKDVMTPQEDMASQEKGEDAHDHKE